MKVSARFLLTLACSLSFAIASAQPPSRVSGSLEDGRTFHLSGNVHPMIQKATDQGAVDNALPLPDITMHLQMSPAQQKQLTQLLADQQNKTSPHFHKWLTPAQYGNEFGASSGDLGKITRWLQSYGFRDIRVSPSKTSIRMAGTASDVQSAFQTNIHTYAASDRIHFANAADPVLPLALEHSVSYISGLNDFHPHPHVRSMPRTSAVPHFTSSISGNHYLTPGDFAIIYDLNALYSKGIDGTGQKIAVAGQTDIDLAQVATFRAAAGLSVNAPTVVLGGTSDPGVSATNQAEAYLDVEWAGALAPKATLVYVNSTDAFTSAQYAIDQNLASVLSLTYGLCEAQFGATASYESMFQQANAQGITIVAASGDNGAADCEGSSNPSAASPTTATQGLAVDYPASSVFVTGVGGTAFNDTANPAAYWSTTNNTNNSSALSYIPETVWNDTAVAGSLAAGGGGVSKLFVKPSWQTGDSVPNDGARDVPDVALPASIDHDQYMICASNGTVIQKGSTTASAADCVNGFRAADSTVDVVGGTSAGAPSFAAIVALLNQQYGTAQGNINPGLYRVAASSTDAFHDVTVGNNAVPCTLGTVDCPATGVGTLGYSAAVGYDLASGLGSVDALNFIDEWQPTFSLSASPASLTLAASSSGTATLQASAVGNFTGTLSLSCSVSAVLTNVTCSVPTSMSVGTSAVVTLKNSSTSLVAPWYRRDLPALPSYGWLAAAVGILLIGFVAVPRKRALRWSLGTAAFGSLLLLGACGGTSGSTTATTGTPATATPVTGTVTITGTSNGISQTTTISVTQE